RLRAEPLQPERGYRRARGRPRLPRAWDRAAALEPARGRPSRRGAPESERGTPRTRALAECGGEAPAEARGVGGALPGARRAAVHRPAEGVRQVSGGTPTVAAPPAPLAAATESVERVVAELRRFVASPPPPRYQRPAPNTDPNDCFPYDLVIGRRSPLAPPIH